MHAQSTAEPPDLTWERVPGGHSRAEDNTHRFHVYQDRFDGSADAQRYRAEITCRRSGMLVASCFVGTVAEAKHWCNSHRSWPAARRA